MTSFITLGQVVERVDALTVSCTRCYRAGRYCVDMLIERHGATGFGVPELLRLLSADCPRRRSVSAYDVYGVRCPALLALFLAQLR